MIRKKTIAEKLRHLFHHTTASLSPSKRVVLAAVGIMIISGIAVMQLALRAENTAPGLSFAAEENDKTSYVVVSGEKNASREEPGILALLGEWNRSFQLKSPIPSGNPTPLPTFTPTPTPTATPTPTPTNTPTPSPTPLPTSTPTPTPERPPQPAPQHMDEWFRRYSAEYGADEQLMRKIAACESGYNTSSHNTTYDYGGMYQFAHSTWVSTRMQMGADPNPDLRFNGEEAIKTAAFKISRGGAGAWANCL